MPKAMSKLNIDIEATKKVADDMIKAFSWKDTKQGQEYWEEVYNSLYAVMRQKVHAEKESK